MYSLYFFYLFEEHLKELYFTFY